MWKNNVEWAGTRSQYGLCALHAGYIRLQISDYVILILFHTVTIVAQMDLNVMLYVHCLIQHEMYLHALEFLYVDLFVYFNRLIT
jgi:hypothetical protein